MAINYLLLKTEIQLAKYAAPFAAGDDATLASMLNAVDVTISINRTFVSTAELATAIVASEYIALSAGQQSLINMVIQCGGGRIDASNSNIQNDFLTCFLAGSTTRTNLLALIKRNGSRAEQLFGIDTILTAQDIAAARVAQ